MARNVALWMVCRLSIEIRQITSDEVEASTFLSSRRAVKQIQIVRMRGATKEAVSRRKHSVQRNKKQRSWKQRLVMNETISLKVQEPLPH